MLNRKQRLILILLLVEIAIAATFALACFDIPAQATFSDVFEKADTNSAIGLPTQPSSDASRWYVYGPNSYAAVAAPYIRNHQLFGLTPDLTDNRGLSFYFTPSMDGLAPAHFSNGIGAVGASLVIDPLLGTDVTSSILLSTVAHGQIGIGSSIAYFVHACLGLFQASISHWEGGATNQPMQSCSVTGPGTIVTNPAGGPSVVHFTTSLAMGGALATARLARIPGTNTVVLTISNGVTFTCTDPAVATDWGDMATFEEGYRNNAAFWVRYAGVWVEGQ